MVAETLQIREQLAKRLITTHVTFTLVIQHDGLDNLQKVILPG